MLELDRYMCPLVCLRHCTWNVAVLQHSVSNFLYLHLIFTGFEQRSSAKFLKFYSTRQRLVHMNHRVCEKCHSHKDVFCIDGCPCFLEITLVPWSFESQKPVEGISPNFCQICIWVFIDVLVRFWGQRQGCRVVIFCETPTQALKNHDSDSRM